MTVVAVLFLVGCLWRAFLIFFDDGFGGPVWTSIVYASCLTWLLGIVLAIHVLTGVSGIALTH